MLRKLLQPKMVRLPNGCTFYTRYQHVGRHKQYVRIQMTYVRKIGLRRQRKRRAAAQTGGGYIDANTVMRRINFAKRSANTDLGRMVIKDTIDLVPLAYRVVRDKFIRRKQVATMQSTPLYAGDDDIISGHFYN